MGPCERKFSALLSPSAETAMIKRFTGLRTHANSRHVHDGELHFSSVYATREYFTATPPARESCRRKEGRGTSEGCML